jgi:two-component system, NtrC family, response regulator AtoC
MRTERVKLLIVDDDEEILFAFQEVFKNDGYDTVVARDGKEALSEVAASNPRAIIMDITMPLLNGLEALRVIRQRNPSVPVILVTGFGTMHTAIKAMQLGAFEYLTKPLDIGMVRDVVRRALTSSSLREPSAQGEVSFNAQILSRYEIIGRSPQMQSVFKLIGSISTTPNHTSVLIFGESGTGKELVARAIHANSHYPQEPFVAINCTALPETLLESELFGYEKGAFTGADERKLGKFEAAGRGTIFLDEIGNLPWQLQQKLLRVLQEREFERLGGNESRRVEARFISATNQDLEAELKQRTFREDLYFRLNVAKIHLPPLRERGEDILLLASHFLMKYNEQLKKNIHGFSDDSMPVLRNYAYPGNVRELENIIERAVMLTKGEMMLPHDIGELLAQPLPHSAALPIVSQVFSTSRAHVIGLFERQFLAHQLSVCNGNVTAAAKASQMTRQNFQRLMKKYGVESPTFKK